MLMIAAWKKYFSLLFINISDVCRSEYIVKYLAKISQLVSKALTHTVSYIASNIFVSSALKSEQL